MKDWNGKIAKYLLFNRRLALYLHGLGGQTAYSSDAALHSVQNAVVFAKYFTEWKAKFISQIDDVDNKLDAMSNQTQNFTVIPQK